MQTATPRPKRRSITRAHVRLGNRLVPTYFLTGLAGCWTGGLLTFTALMLRGYSPAISAAVPILSIAGMLLWVAIRRRIAGHESFIAIENLIAAVLPVWALDAALQEGSVLVQAQFLGLGVFMIWGRVGCFFNGCCYGAQSDIGVTYRHGHHDPRIRRFPAQLVSSAGWACLTAAGLIAWSWGPSGAVLPTMMIGYGPLRLIHEFLRDDPRPRVLGWTTGMLGALAIWIGGLFLTPLQTPWIAVIVAIFLLLATFSHRWWLALPSVELPAPAPFPELKPTPTSFHWAGYHLAVSRQAEFVLLSVSRHDGLMSGAEADIVLRHYGAVDVSEVGDGTYLGLIPYESAEPEVDYLARGNRDEEAPTAFVV